jgi:hypothetical protein
MNQFSALKARTPVEFHRELEAAYGKPIVLRINDNSSTLISARPSRSGPVKFSIHRMFLSCSSEVLVALAQYLKGPTRASQQTLRAFMNSRTSDITRPDPHTKTPNLRTRGMVYDLHKLAAEVNTVWFGGSIEARVTWGRGRTSPGRRRHIMFGSYDARMRLIRIHPALDSKSVPEYFVRFVLYHEMLHALLDPKHNADGRHYVHTADFRRREKQFPDYARAMEFEKDFMRRR